ncbi:MAG TPA: TIGR01777 family oxidoreductase [Gemmataceae bacterium]|nr:TIGR01777 family oxidoreductase [Gemmataceae bacterium]
MRVLVTGGTGLVGRRVVARLRGRGDEAIVLSRSARPDVLTGDPTTPGPWLDALAGCDAVMHLAGEPIAGHRWTREFKQKVLDSRVVSTRVIAEALARSPTRSDGSPRVLVNASAVGYYGMYDDKPTEFVEDDLPGSGFLADVCVAWERATEPAAAAGVRVAVVRVGFVLANDGGALPQLVRPFRWFLGGRIGSGRQWVSWIHVDDLAGLFLLALDLPDARGALNGTAPEPVTNWGFCQTLAKVLRRPCWLPAPRFGLRLLMGEMSELATQGQRVIPAKAKALGYEFRYALLEPALRNVLGGA